MENKSPELSKKPKECKPCDMMVSLGLLTASCENIKDKDGKSLCMKLIEPLEKGNDDPVDTLARVIVKAGADDINETLDRMNFLIYRATMKAKDELIKQGKLNPDGTAKKE